MTISEYLVLKLMPNINIKRGASAFRYMDKNEFPQNGFILSKYNRLS